MSPDPFLSSLSLRFRPRSSAPRPPRLCARPEGPKVGRGTVGGCGFAVAFQSFRICRRFGTFHPPVASWGAWGLEGPRVRVLEAAAGSASRFWSRRLSVSPHPCPRSPRSGPWTGIVCSISTR
eukprot:9152007-Pyramimonas_sp.AAC.1